MNASNSIIEKYISHIHTLCDQYKLPGIEKDSIRSNAYVSFLYAENKYGNTRNGFWDYAALCIHEGIDLLRRKQNKHRRLFSPVSLEQNIGNQSAIRLIDIVADEKAGFLGCVILKDFFSQLPTWQQDILAAVKSGYTLTEIMRHLSVSAAEMDYFQHEVSRLWEEYNAEASG